MAVAVLDNIILLLTLYVAALIFALQHVADRYTPHLIWPILRRHALIPLFNIFLAIISAGIQSIDTKPLNLFLLILLIWNIGLVLVYCYLLWRLIANPWWLLKLARKELTFVDALEEILLKAIQRDDRMTIMLALDSIHKLGSGSISEEQEVLEWFAEHTDLLTSEWLSNLLLRQLSKRNFGAQALESQTKLLRAMLIQALNDESESRAITVLYFVLSRIRKTQPWEDTQGKLLAEIGVPLWRIGEWVASVPRVWRIDAQLRGLRSYYIASVYETTVHVKKLHSSNSTEALCETLTKLIEETLALEFIEMLHDLISDKAMFLLLTVKMVEEIRVTLTRPLTKITEGMKRVEEGRKTLSTTVPLTADEKEFYELREKLEQLINVVNAMSVGGKNI